MASSVVRLRRLLMRDMSSERVSEPNGVRSRMAFPGHLLAMGPQGAPNLASNDLSEQWRNGVAYQVTRATHVIGGYVVMLGEGLEQRRLANRQGIPAAVRMSEPPHARCRATTRDGW